MNLKPTLLQRLQSSAASLPRAQQQVIAVLLKDPTNLVQLVLYGGYGPATAGHPRPFGMPPAVLELDDRDISAVLTHLRSQWGNQASEVTPLQINRIRAAQGH